MSTPNGGYSPNPAASSKVATVGLAMQIAAGVAVLFELLGLVMSVLQLAGISTGRFARPSGGGLANLGRIPIGIWALITLLDSEVKSSFRS